MQKHKHENKTKKETFLQIQDKFKKLEALLEDQNREIKLSITQNHLNTQDTFFEQLNKFSEETNQSKY